MNRGKEKGVPVVEANVGVTLVVDGGEITVVERRESGTTYGRITIPPAIASNPDERDRGEQEFLRLREEEMRLRYQATIERLTKQP